MIIDNQEMSIILPARIVEYFPEDQTATIQISAESVFSNSDLVSQTAIRKPIQDVPVHTPSGGGWSMTMPIKEGDTCLMVFSQVGYDHWLYKDKDVAGKQANLPRPWLRRQFSINDGFAFVGFNTIPRRITDYTTDGSQWRNSNATQNIHLKDDLSIEVNSTTVVTINAPSVIVNCDTSEVNCGTRADVTAPDVKVVADNKVEIATPLAEFSTNVVVKGKLDVVGATTTSMLTSDTSVNSVTVVASGAISGASIAVGSMTLGGASFGPPAAGGETDVIEISGSLRVTGTPDVAGTIEAIGETTLGVPLVGTYNGVFVEAVETHLHVSSASGSNSGPPIAPPPL